LMGIHGWALAVVLTVGSIVGLTVGLTVGRLINYTWPCWAINLSKAFDSPDERLLLLSAKGV
jgi:hypothetical protein